MNWRNNLLRAVTTVGLSAACILAAALPEVLGAEPHGLSLRQDKSGVTIELDGGPFAAYRIDEGNKPYLWPVVGPTGKPMTRAYPMRDLPEEPAAQRDHPHHRGITFGHESVGGVDTWHERLTFDEFIGQGKMTEQNRARLATLGRIAHREFSRVSVDGDRAVIEEVCDHMDPAGRPFLVEQRRLTFRAEGETRTIDIDQDRQQRRARRQGRLVEAGPLVRLSRPGRRRAPGHRDPEPSRELPPSDAVARPHLRTLRRQSVCQQAIRSRAARRHDDAHPRRRAAAPPPLPVSQG